MFLATAVFAVGWAAVLWDTRFVTDPSGPWDVVKYGFLGAYAFVTSMLIRRFFQSDLRPSAYATAVFRIILVLLIIVVLHQVMDKTSTMAYRGELAVAFVVGFFPSGRPAVPAAGDVKGAGPHRSARHAGPIRLTSSTGSTSGTRPASPRRASRTCRT